MKNVKDQEFQLNFPSRHKTRDSEKRVVFFVLSCRYWFGYLPIFRPMAFLFNLRVVTFSLSFIITNKASRSNILITRLFNIGHVYARKTFVNPQTLDYAKIESRDGGLIEADIQNFCYPPVLLLHPFTPYVITGPLLSDMETLHYYFVFIDQVAKLWEGCQKFVAIQERSSFESKELGTSNLCQREVFHWWWERVYHHHKFLSWSGHYHQALQHSHSAKWLIDPFGQVITIPGFDKMVRILMGTFLNCCMRFFLP